MDYGTLRVTTPDGQVREYPIDASPVLIGRADSNRVVIDHVSVSRRHARFLFEGGDAMVEDLGSATGTFVAGQRLAPETPRPFRPGEALRFGDAQAVFIAGGVQVAVASAASAPPPSTGAASAPVAASPTRGSSPIEQAIVISLISPSVPMTAGSTTTATCVIENRGAETDTLTIAVQNLPQGWTRVTRPTIQLTPGGRDEVTIVLQPPRSPEATAGEHSFAAAAFSQVRGVEVRALGRLTISAFGAHTVEVKPVRARKSFDATVVNDGNVPISLGLAGRDPEGALTVSCDPASFELAPGERKQVAVQAKTAKGRFFGAERIYPFEVDARSATATVSAGAELQSRPPWLIIKWFLLAAIVAAVAIGGYLAYSAFFGGDDKASPKADATPTPEPAATPEGTAVQPTAAPGATTPEAVATIVVGGRINTINSPKPEAASCLRAHPTPAVDAAVTFYLCNDDKAKVIQGPRTVPGDQHVWWLVQKEGGTAQGWAAEANPASGEKWMQPIP